MPPLIQRVDAALTGLPVALESRVSKLSPRLHAPLVALWLTLSIAGVVLAWLTWKQLSDHVDRGVAMAEFNNSLDNVFSALLDAETGQRGFIITGDDAYLIPFNQAMESFPARFDRLAQIALDDRDLQKQVLELRGRAELKLSEMRKSIEARRRDGFTAAATQINSDEGRKLMEEIRQLVTEMRMVRPNVLTIAGETTRSRLRRANLTSLSAALLGVGLGFFAFYLARLGYVQERRERELAEAKLRAEQSNEQKSAFLANMSHEIRTPMNAIIGFADLLAHEVREPRQQQYLRSIRTASDSLLQLINDVLDMSKIEAGVLELNPEPTDPREICEFVRTVFTEQATKKGVKLACHTAEDLPRALLLDRTRLRQVLVNLVGNAVKFTDQGSIRTQVNWQKQDDHSSRITLLIEVEDTGIGIPQNRLDAIFKPFVQADARRPQERQGSGLGLAIVRRLIETMGGTVVVASVVDKGTIFHLRIPNVTVSARLPQAFTSNGDGYAEFNALKPSRILVVDDNELNRQLMAGLFERSHHEVHFGMDGREAVNLTLALKPDVVLLDIRMPVMDGRMALAEIRATAGFELLPVIAVTASSLADEERLLRQQFSGYVRKPFTPQALFDELAQFLPRGEQAGVAAEPLPPRSAPNDATSWAELAVELHKLEATEWPSIRDSVAINEVRTLAARLRALGEAAACPPLVDYALTLQRQAETYDAVALESEIARFPKLVSDIEARTV